VFNPVIILDKQHLVYSAETLFPVESTPKPVLTFATVDSKNICQGAFLISKSLGDSPLVSRIVLSTIVCSPFPNGASWLAATIIFASRSDNGRPINPPFFKYRPGFGGLLRCSNKANEPSL
jgi:hypothetical protein